VEAHEAEVNIRRIVVGLDIAPHSRPALAAAAALAGELDAELEALFVESDELHRLAALPFARELGFSTATSRGIDPAALEHSLRAHVEEARRALAALAAPLAVRWSLRVTRGSVTEEILTASAGADLAIVGIARWDPEALRLAGNAPASLLVLPRAAKAGGPLVAICPVDVAPERSIPLVCSLANAAGDGLTILAVGADVASAAAWCEKAGELLRLKGRRAQLEIVRDGQAEALKTALDRLAPSALAILAPRAP
jgi:nucleotide-binding universal stress UspA family protein